MSRGYNRHIVRISLRREPICKIRLDRVGVQLCCDRVGSNCACHGVWRRVRQPLALVQRGAGAEKSPDRDSNRVRTPFNGGPFHFAGDSTSNLGIPCFTETPSWQARGGDGGSAYVCGSRNRRRAGAT